MTPTNNFLIAKENQKEETTERTTMAFQAVTQTCSNFSSKFHTSSNRELRDSSSKASDFKVMCQIRRLVEVVVAEEPAMQDGRIRAGLAEQAGRATNFKIRNGKEWIEVG